MLTVTTFSNVDAIALPKSIEGNSADAEAEFAADEQLARRVRLFLVSRQIGELRSVVVAARNGRVRLSGRVSSFYHRQLAISTAHRVAGVRTVDDQLIVAAPRGQQTGKTALGAAI